MFNRSVSQGYDASDSEKQLPRHMTVIDVTAVKIVSYKNVFQSTDGLGHSSADEEGKAEKLIVCLKFCLSEISV